MSADAPAAVRSLHQRRHRPDNLEVQGLTRSVLSAEVELGWSISCFIIDRRPLSGTEWWHLIDKRTWALSLGQM